MTWIYSTALCLCFVLSTTSHISSISPEKIKKDADPLLGTISSFCSGMLFVVYQSFSVALLVQTTSRKRGGSSCDWRMQAQDQELI